MANSTSHESWFRLSLRHLAVLATLWALAVVSLLYASEAWQLVVAAIAVVVFAWAVLTAVVYDDARRGFGLGLVVAMIAYGLVLWLVGMRGESEAHSEFNPQTGRLPTSRLLLPLYDTVAEMRWVDFRTGREIVDFDPETTGVDSQYVSLSERPGRGVFMRIGHLWWAMLIGYLGGWVGRWIDLLRLRKADSLASGRP